jgi:hypothetical protein
MTIKITYDYRRDVSEVSVPLKKVKRENGTIHYVTYKSVGYIGAIKKKNYGRSNAISKFTAGTGEQNSGDMNNSGGIKSGAELQSSEPNERQKFKDSILNAIIDNELDYFLNIVLNKQYTYIQKVSAEEFSPSAEEMEIIHREEEKLNRRWKTILEDALCEYSMKLKKSKGAAIVQLINAGIKKSKHRKTKLLEKQMNEND